MLRYTSAVMAFLVFLVATRALAGERGAPWRLNVIDDTSRGADGVKLADVNGDGRPDIATGWEEGGVTRVYVNPGSRRSRGRWPAVTVGRTRSVEDAVLADLDGDGALDVVSSCEGGTKAMYVHWAPARRAQYLSGDAWKQETLPASKGRMRWMYAEPVQVDGRRGVDLVAAGKDRGAEIGWFESPADPRSLGDYAWHPISGVGWVMSIIPADMDGDGDVDIAVSDRRGKLRGCRWLENPGASPAQSGAWPNHFVGGRDAEVMFMTLADLDADGREDVLVAAKPAQVLWFRRLDGSGRKWEKKRIPYPGNMGDAKSVAAGDIDLDGRTDLVVSCEHATPPKSGVVWMSRSGADPRGEWTAREISGPRGIKYDRLELVDLDADGDLDVLTCEERDAGRGIGVFWYENPSRPGGRGR
ncbi:MAG: FG-GAP repeat domain-containing protein [Planctomycetota bacterium]|jgi:hypothetical protein